jgi:hypothetical protein
MVDRSRPVTRPIQIFSGQIAVATSFEYHLHPVGDVLAGALTYSAAGRIAELMQSFAKFTEAAPDEMVPLGELLPSKEGPVFINHLCYVGEARVSNELLAPLRVLKPKHDDIRVMSYFEAQAGGLLQRRPPTSKRICF